MSVSCDKYHASANRQIRTLSETLVALSSQSKTREAPGENDISTTVADSSPDFS
jgi:hypothetical protein